MAAVSRSSDSKLNLVLETLDEMPRLVIQAELFPLRAIVEFPNAVTGADVWGEVIAEDNHHYVVKGEKGTEYVRASEWIGTQLADALELPCAAPKLILLQSNELLFGSRKIQSVASKIETTRLLTTFETPPHGLHVPGLRAALSEIYAVDMFIGNVDRHDQNFIAVRSGSSCNIVPIDFARSLFWNASLDAFPSAVHHTVRIGRQIRRRHGFDLSAALMLLDRIATLSSARFMTILSRTPEEWLPAKKRNEFEDWWINGGRSAKLESLRRGLSDDTLL